LSSLPDYGDSELIHELNAAFTAMDPTIDEDLAVQLKPLRRDAGQPHPIDVNGKFRGAL